MSIVMVHGCIHMSTFVKLYTLNMCSLLCVNYTAIKLHKKIVVVTSKIVKNRKTWGYFPSKENPRCYSSTLRRRTDDNEELFCSQTFRPHQPWAAEGLRLI